VVGVVVVDFHLCVPYVGVVFDVGKYGLIPVVLRSSVRE
jgi:hypothetical protein